jgi:hypothetical protein
VPAAVAEEEALGRLFFTPERRQQLDRQREMNLLDQQQLPADPTLTIDGVVTRSSGRRTAWVNGHPQHEDDLWSGLTVTPRHGDPGKVLLEHQRFASGESACRTDRQPQLRRGQRSAQRRPDQRSFDVNRGAR